MNERAWGGDEWWVGGRAGECIGVGVCVGLGSAGVDLGETVGGRTVKTVSITLKSVRLMFLLLLARQHHINPSAQHAAGWV